MYMKCYNGIMYVDLLTTVHILFFLFINLFGYVMKYYGIVCELNGFI